jgi:hypothetical protein
MSPEASGPIRPVVFDLTFGIDQSRKHSRCRFPGNFAFGVEAPHSVTGGFELAKDLGQKLGSGAAWAMIFDPLIFDIHPKSKDPGHTNFDQSTLIAKIADLRSVKTNRYMTLTGKSIFFER